MDKDLIVKNILKKLTKLQCPFVGNGKDSWITEILFKPSLERYNLIQWILEKLEINAFEALKQQISLESKVQNLQAILSALGISGEKDTAIIEGTASQPKQLAFWQTLISLLWSKTKLANANSSLCNSNSENNSMEYENSCDYIGRVCESINFKHAFDTELQLFPPYLKKEIKPILEEKKKPLLSIDDVKKMYCEKYNVQEPDIISDCGIGELSLTFNEIMNCEIPDESLLAETENNFSTYVDNFKNSTDSFSNAYDNLKLYLLNVLPEKSENIGIAFKAADEKLQSVLQLKHSSALLASADLDLENLNSDISNFQIPPELLSDSKLTEYIKIISEAEKEE